MQIFYYYLISFFCMTSLQQVISQTDVPSPLAILLQENPSFQSFLKENPQIYQLLSSNQELVTLLKANPILIKQTEEHAKFLNTFLQETPNLPQIIKDNPNVYAFILKQVDHAVQTGQDKTIVIQMTEADAKEVQEELKAAQQPLKAETQSNGVLSDKANVSGISSKVNGQPNPFAGLSREEMQALLTKYQTGQQSVLSEKIQAPVANLSTIPTQTSFSVQQMNNSNPVPTNGFSANGQMTNSVQKDTVINPDDISLTNIEDLIKIRALYILMYNKQPGSVADLQDFYNIVLAKLNIRTRKQVDEFLSRFKISGDQNNGQSSGLQSGINGVSGINPGYSTAGKGSTIGGSSPLSNGAGSGLYSPLGSTGYSSLGNGAYSTLGNGLGNNGLHSTLGSGTGYSTLGSGGYSSSGNGYSNGYIDRAPSWRDRKMSCKMRIFCRHNPWSPMCRY